MPGIGPGELVVILGLALLLFGPKKMPEIGRSLGAVMRELRRASNDFMSAIETEEPDESRYNHHGPSDQFEDYEHSHSRNVHGELDSEHTSEHRDETHHTKEGE
jgi:TatA/E family protein of Tat protein translocase